MNPPRSTPVADDQPLTRYLGDLRRWPGVAETVDCDHTMRHDDESRRRINPARRAATRSDR